jgi:hypothetical protein
VSVVDDALRDPRAKDLFDELSREINIEFRSSTDSSWSSNIEAPGTALIYAANTTAPAEALGHELLHIRTQLRGYRRLRISVSLTEPRAFREWLFTALDNELQHHRMFPEYLRRGFSSTRFFRDNDAETEAYLRSELAAHDTFRDLLVPFLSFIAPGGQLLWSAKRRLRAQFLGAPYGDSFTRVETIVRNWAQQDDLDAEATVREILLLVNPDQLTWVGYGTEAEFPGNGFFVGRHFGERS